MKFHPARLLHRLFESLWFVPSAMTLGAIILAYATVEVDRRASQELVRGISFLFDIGVEGARETLSSIATSVITVTGVVFSVTIVALQLAASQFTPRVLRTYLADRGNQWVLGIFIGTFTYTLLVQRSVGTPTGSEESFTPYIAVTLAILFVLISIGAFIYFINHIAQSMRASVIVESVASDGRELVETLFPEQVGEGIDPADLEEAPPLPSGRPHPVCATKSGYLDSVDADELLSVAEEGRAVIRMRLFVGDFVMPGEVLADVWLDAGRWDEESGSKIEKKVRKAFVLGGQWTLHQDLERALVELTDIAIRALSPSLNDPTTATLCVDRLGEVLSLLGTRSFPSNYRMDSSGRVRFIARRVGWPRLVEVSFEKLRVHAARSPSVLIRAIEIIGRTKHRIPAHRHQPLDEQVREMLSAARRSFEAEVDLRRAEQAAQRALLAPQDVVEDGVPRDRQGSQGGG